MPATWPASPAGAQPAGPPPLPPASGDVTEVDRTVNASRSVSLGDHIISAGLPLTGQRVTLRLDGPVAHILAGGVLVRTVACPVPPEARPRLRGARPGTARPPRLPAPLVVTRRVSVRGAIMVGGQRIQVGLARGLTWDFVGAPSATRTRDLLLGYPGSRVVMLPTHG